MNEHEVRAAFDQALRASARVLAPDLAQTPLKPEGVEVPREFVCIPTYEWTQLVFAIQPPSELRKKP